MSDNRSVPPSTALDTDMTVPEAIENLQKAKDNHLEIGRAILQAYGGAFYGLDFLAVASLNRSLCLLRAFSQLIEDRNMIAAAPLLRMQLDNALRFSAAWMVKEPHEFAIKVLQGVPIKKMKGTDGNFLTDRHLVQAMSAEYPWVENVYKNCSGYIHLSEKHIFNSMTLGEEDRTVTLKISDRDDWLPDSTYLEAIAAFAESTKILLKFAHGWAFTKANPEVARRGKAEDAP